MGREEGQKWQLRLQISPNTQQFSGYFELDDKTDMMKRRIRDKDRLWINYHLPCFVGVYEIHHNWNEGARMQLFTRQRHQEVEAGLKGEHPAK